MKNENQNNPLLCDPETGVCEVPSFAGSKDQKVELSSGKLLKAIYFTDPICSSCWGIEPQLRKLKLEYGSALKIEYRMGGLLADWSYSSGGISKPSDVARHWDEVSAYYDMPIDGDVWIEDSLHSSYPPSIAFKAAQMQDEDKAVQFLRNIRELLFLEKKNITRWEHILNAAQDAELDIDKFRTDYEGDAVGLFQKDLELAKDSGVRGFPTIIFDDGSGVQERVYGSKPYEVYEKAIKYFKPSISPVNYEADWKSLFTKYTTLTAREFSTLSGIERAEVDAYLNTLSDNSHLQKLETKNGSMWKYVQTEKELFIDLDQ